MCGDPPHLNKRSWTSAKLLTTPALISRAGTAPLSNALNWERGRPARNEREARKLLVNFGTYSRVTARCGRDAPAPTLLNKKVSLVAESYEAYAALRGRTSRSMRLAEE